MRTLSSVGSPSIVSAARCAALVAALIGSAASLSAQTCEPGSTSHEADLFAIRSLSLAMGRASAIDAPRAGTVRAGVEAIWLPRIDDETARPTICRPGKEPENVNALPGVARARIAITLPARVTLEASWLPPVTLNAMHGNLVGVALSGARQLTQELAVSARVHALFGRIAGPFTCPQDAITRPSSECFEGTRSDDHLDPNVHGADVAFGWTPHESRYAWYAGAGYSELRPRFAVHFINKAGTLDTTRVIANMTRMPFFGGVTRSIGGAWRASAEAYGTSRDGATVRVTLDRTFRSR